MGVMFAFAAGCGPIVSGVQIMQANIAVNAAETAGAKKYAVYEYTAAREYLKKAREENAYSDFWAARVFADKSLDCAIRARKKSEVSSQAEQPAVLPSSLIESTPAAKDGK